MKIKVFDIHPELEYSIGKTIGVKAYLTKHFVELNLNYSVYRDKEMSNEDKTT